MRRTLTTIGALGLLFVGSLALAFSGGLKPALAQAPATASLSGTITDEASGEAIAGAWVFYWSRGDNGAQAVGAVTADSSGKFTISNVPEGDYQLTVIAVGYQPERKTISLEGDVTLDFALAKPAPPATGGISGTVTDAGSSDPIKDAKIIYARQDGALPALLHRRGGVVETDESGAYSIERLQEGAYKLTATAKGYEPHNVADVSVTAGQTTTVNFALTKLAEVPKGTVSGSVKAEATGDAIADARVILFPASVDLRKGLGARLHAVTDASGSFTIADVPEGTYAAMVHAPAYRPEIERDIAVTADATTTVELSLEANGSIPPFMGRSHDDDDDRGNPMGRRPKLERMERPGIGIGLGLGLSGRAHAEVEDD